MEKKWTPGPWSCGPASNYHGFYIAPSGTLPTLAACERFGEVMTVNCFNFHGQTEANAHLIAAAPELYDALEELRLAVVYSDNVASIFIEDAEEALSKARGETGERGE